MLLLVESLLPGHVCRVQHLIFTLLVRVSSRVLNVNPGLELPYCINHVSHKPFVFSPFISSLPSKYLQENMGMNQHFINLHRSAFRRGMCGLVYSFTRTICFLKMNLWQQVVVFTPYVRVLRILHAPETPNVRYIEFRICLKKMRFTWYTYFTSLLWASALKSPIRNAAPLN